MAIQLDDDAVLELRVQGVKDSATRVRLAFFVMVVACGAVLITLYNAHFSWNERFLTPYGGMRGPTLARTDGAEPLATLREHRDEEMVRSLVDNKNVSVGLLGLRIASCDLGVFGALAMCIVSMYTCLCTRRAKEDICPLVSEVLCDKLRRNYVWYGIRQSLVLNTELRNGPQDSRLRLVQHAVRTLNWLPAFSIASILLGEVFYWIADEAPPLLSLTLHYQIQFAVSVGIGLVLLIFVIHLSKLTDEYRSEMLASAGCLEARCQETLQVKSATAGR